MESQVFVKKWKRIVKNQQPGGPGAIALQLRGKGDSF